MNANEHTTEAQDTESTPNDPPEPWQENFAQDLLSRILPDNDPNQTRRAKEPRLTSMGTPCARSWDDPWIAKVEAAEQRLQHRVCGARMMSANPCELAPNHDNGRCRFHGGFALTGGAPGNRNAVIHGLYSRRLRVCDSQCPLWGQCPCAGPDVEAMPAVDRPTCPYEQTEYNTVLTDALSRAAVDLNRDPMSLHIAHNVALLQVMLTRASLALRNAPLIDTVTATRDATEHAGAYEMQSTKPSAYLQAFTRIASEYRHFAAMLHSGETAKISVAEHLNRTSRTLADTDLSPDSQEMLQPDAFGALNETERHMRNAVEQAFAGDNAAATESFRTACRLSEQCKSEWDRPLNGLRYPDPGKLSEATVKLLLNHIKKKPPLLDVHRR
jgi:hypothetical protein